MPGNLSRITGAARSIKGRETIVRPSQVTGPRQVIEKATQATVFLLTSRHLGVGPPVAAPPYPNPLPRWGEGANVFA